MLPRVITTRKLAMIFSNFRKSREGHATRLKKLSKTVQQVVDNMLEMASKKVLIFSELKTKTILQ